MSDLVVRVLVAQEDYAVPVRDVLEVAELGTIVPLPGAPAAVLGLRNVRGEVLPVLDLAVILGLPRAGAPKRLLVATSGDDRAGLAVDEIVDVGVLPGEVEHADSGLLEGAVLVEGSLVGLLDTRALLGAVEVGVVT